MIEVDPTLALNVHMMASIRNGSKRLFLVFQDVATHLPVEKHEVKATMQRLRKAGRIKSDANGNWTVKS